MDAAPDAKNNKKQDTAATPIHTHPQHPQKEQTKDKKDIKVIIEPKKTTTHKKDEKDTCVKKTEKINDDVKATHNIPNKTAPPSDKTAPTSDKPAPKAAAAPADDDDANTQKKKDDVSVKAVKENKNDRNAKTAAHAGADEKHVTKMAPEWKDRSCIVNVYGPGQKIQYYECKTCKVQCMYMCMYVCMCVVCVCVCVVLCV